MISGDQIRAGRALARLSARKLADLADVDITTVQRLESGDPEKMGSAKLDTVRRIKDALEEAGVVFLPDGHGVTKKSGANKAG